MGCTASKLENEDTVRRCKERRRLIKEAVYARHHLAAAHSDYLRSLRLTGSALLDFSSGESLSVSDQTPPILLHNNINNNNNTTSSSSSSFRTHSDQIPLQQQQHHQRSKLYHDSSVTSPSLKPPPLPPQFSSSSPSSSPTIRSSKLPHILSESSLSSTPIPRYKSSHDDERFTKLPPLSSISSSFERTPSQASSAWNWENFYPPSPPDSEFFQQPKQQNQHSQQPNHHLDGEEEEEETEREEVHCSEWGDHYSTTSSDTESGNDDDDDDADRESRSELGSRSNFGSSVHNETQSKSNFRPKSEKFDEAGSSVSWNVGAEQISDMKMVVRHRDLAEIAAAIKEYFEKAASGGESVSELLETGRAQLDRSFRQLKKTVYHSNSVLSSLSSSWTSKPPLAIKYRLDAASIDESGGLKSHCSTLERLLAWEKKLYEEVKAREGVNIEHEKKLSSLQSQEYKGEDEVKLDKTKTSIKRLQSLIVVTSQAVSTTSSAIIHVRDSELAPQLVELCHGFMYMWRSMNQFHEVQNQIIQQVRGLVNQASKGESTSELHRQATSHLESTVSAWHSSFCRLIKYQRDYVQSLHGWLKLTLQHVGSDKTNVSKDSSISVQALSDLFAFLDEWKQALDRCPDTVASEAIKSFVNVIHVISVKQTEELKIKRKTESASKELEKKATALRNLEKKFYQSYSTVGLGIPDGGQVIDARDPLADKKLELAGCQRRVEDEMSRHAKAVEVTRAMTLNNIQTGLPGVFQAMTGFSGLFAEALEVVCARSYSIK
ncbi:hypothetical protein AQUCO_01300841v1 [Aquilegia coerulea]|uniref:DUF632 domain-containing protein n=1 Tax=Aquilegia coerulea TaxID=218851 RepID=A0A2G5E3U3_AQUCA|nr:hypothetical protein AQUCO_01300841v1 [Aquilegia coerulea]